MDNKNTILLICIALTFSFLFASCHASKKAKKDKNAIKTNIPIDKPTTEIEEETFVPKESKTAETTENETVEIDATYSFENETTLKKTQILLFLSGYAPGRVDGLMKEQTMQAITAFQNDHELSIGDMTSKTLDDIGVGMMDFEVSDVQEALEKKGYDPGPVDNLVGNMTRTAYTEFLQNNKFPFNRFTPQIKEALFSDDPKYKNEAKSDALFYEDPISNISADTSNNIRFVPLIHAKIQDVQRALFAKGYDAGDMSETMTPQIADALFKYQVDKQLPVGGLNEDTLKSLGFR